MSDLPAHWLYPVNTTTDSWVDTLDGPEPVTPDAFRRLDFERQAFWDLSSGYRAMRADDLLWVYFARPEKTVGALGRVCEVRENVSGTGYEVVLAWERTATVALRTTPIPLAMLGRAPRSVHRADTDQADTLQTWVRDLLECRT